VNKTYVFIGLVNGSIYALLALGIVLMYQITGVLNFAFGAFGMVAAFCFASLTESLLHPWPALFAILVLTVIVGGALGVVTLPAQSANRVVKATACLGLLSALQGAVVVIWGTTPRPTPLLTGAVAFRAFDIAITWQRVLAIVIAMVGSAAILAFLKVGPLGAALRAMATSIDISRLVGLPIRRLWVLAWALSTAVAALAAMLILPDIGLDAGALSFIVLTPLAAALAARFESIPIALVSALGLGVAQGAFQGSHDLAPYRDALPLVLVIASLAFARTNRTYERV
jgi:branched-chain amino acid transport system permease protein